MYGFTVLDTHGHECPIVAVTEHHLKWYGTDRDGLTQVWEMYLPRHLELKTEWVYSSNFKVVVFPLSFAKIPA